MRAGPSERETVDRGRKTETTSERAREGRNLVEREGEGGRGREREKEQPGGVHRSRRRLLVDPRGEPRLDGGEGVADRVPDGFELLDREHLRQLRVLPWCRGFRVCG